MNDKPATYLRVGAEAPSFAERVWVALGLPGRIGVVVFGVVLLLLGKPDVPRHSKAATTFQNLRGSQTTATGRTAVHF